MNDEPLRKMEGVEVEDKTKLLAMMDTINQDEA